MVTSSKGGLLPEKLPPTTNAAKFHSFRVHLQVIVWKSLNTDLLLATEWGWEKNGDMLVPIPTNQVVAPENILKFIRCKCKLASKNPCSSQICSCKKNGLPCVPSCGDCRGEYCVNKVTILISFLNIFVHP